MSHPISVSADHLHDLAVQAGIKQVVSAAGSLEFPSAATRLELMATFHDKIFGHEPFGGIAGLETPAPAPAPPSPPPQLERIELDTGPITFSGGVPVGGQSHLSLFPSGAYSFTGHFHDSGAPSYDTQLVWVLRAGSGTAFTFVHHGRVHGTFEAGSLDDDWGDSGTNAALAAAWADVSQAYAWRWSAGVNIDIGQMVDQAIKTVGQVAAVVAVVA